MKKIELSLNDIYESITKLEIALEQNDISIYTKNKEIVISSIRDKYIKERVFDKYGKIDNIYYIA